MRGQKHFLVMQERRDGAARKRPGAGADHEPVAALDRRDRVELDAGEGADHVLRRPGKADKEALDVAVEVAADAVEAILEDGPDAAMNRFNTLAQ